MKKAVEEKRSSGLVFFLVLLFASVTSCAGPSEPTVPAVSADILAPETPASFSRAITIDYTRVQGTDQKRFPVLVSGTYDGTGGTPDLRTTAFGGKVQNPSGYDVGFYTSPDCTRGKKMDWETEAYSAQTGSVAYWVKVPTVSHTTNTVFYICYGAASITTDQSSPAAVWDAQYQAVWHLADKGGLDLSNSTRPRFALTNPGPVSSAAGKIGGGTNKFEDGSYYLDNADVSLGADQAVTVSMWKKILAADGWPENTIRDGNHISFGMGADHDAVNSMTLWAPFFCDPAWNYALEGPDLFNYWCGPPSYYDRWVYITVVYDPVASRFKGLYLDGNLAGSTTNGPTTDGPVTGFRLGQDRIGHGPDPSQFDEVRISKSARTADWIKTEFNNQNNPASFYTIGAEIIHQ